MAIWNFTVEFLPYDELYKICGAIPDSLTFERFDDHRWWYNDDDLIRVTIELDKIFGRSQLRGKGMRTWHQGPHSITIYFDEQGMLEAIAAKADARQPCDHFLSSLVDFAKSQRCLLYLSSLEIVLPEMDRLLEAFTRSVSRGFFTDPTKTLEDVTRIEFERVAPTKDKRNK